MNNSPVRLIHLKLLVGLIATGVLVFGAYYVSVSKEIRKKGSSTSLQLHYQPRKVIDSSGYTLISKILPNWRPTPTLEEIGESCQKAFDLLMTHDPYQSFPGLSSSLKIQELMLRASFLNSQGESRKAYDVLAEAHEIAEGEPELAEEWFYTLIYFQGLTALRRGEDENCILCRGESSCIFPIAKSAIHTNPTGSRTAIRHFSDYLQQFPDDLEVRWLLNLAYMTLGEHPNLVDSRHLLTFERFQKSEFDIGRFRVFGHLVGVNRFNQAGGAIMDDFDNDGLLDIVTTSFDPSQSMAFFRNKGDGTFEDRTQEAGLAKQLGGLYC